MLVGAVLGTSLAEAQIQISRRTPKIENYPCKVCHGAALSKKNAFSPKDLERFQKVEEHEGMVFQHMPEVWNCYLCHSYQQPNALNLLDGTLLSYNDAPTLCGQCHGIVKRDWDQAFHGKVSGGWKGERTKFACTDCHDAHNPKFPKMTAFPPPQHPRKHPIKKGE